MVWKVCRQIRCAAEEQGQRAARRSNVWNTCITEKGKLEERSGPTMQTEELRIIRLKKMLNNKEYERFRF